MKIASEYSSTMTKKLDANFKVVTSSKYSAEVLIVLESRGGAGKDARNPDYARQLSRILSTLKKYSCEITRIDLMSRVAENLKNPKLDLEYPIVLRQLSSIEKLRKEIQSAQKSVGQRPGVVGGNSTKRIGIFVKVGPKFVLKGIQAVLT